MRLLSCYSVVTDVLVDGYSVWNLGWIDWHWYRFCYECLSFRVYHSISALHTRSCGTDATYTQQLAVSLSNTLKKKKRLFQEEDTGMSVIIVRDLLGDLSIDGRIILKEILDEV